MSAPIAPVRSFNGFVSSPTITPPRAKTAFSNHGEGFRRVFVGFVWVRFANVSPNSDPAAQVAKWPAHVAETPGRGGTLRDILRHFRPTCQTCSLAKEHPSVGPGARARLTHGCARNFSESLDFVGKTRENKSSRDRIFCKSRCAFDARGAQS